MAPTRTTPGPEENPPPVRAVIARIEALRRRHAARPAPETRPAPSEASGAPPRATRGPRPPAEPVVEALERLRALRTMRGRDLSIGRLLARTRDDADRAQRRLGTLVTLWHELVPAALADRTELAALTRGVLHVNVESSAVAFELDRRLREGLLAALRQRHRGTLTRVKLKVDPGAAGGRVSGADARD